MLVILKIDILLRDILRAVITLSVISLSIIFLSVLLPLFADFKILNNFTEKAKSMNKNVLGTVCHFANCDYAECHIASADQNMTE